VEHPGGESGKIEHTWGMYNKPTGCSTPAYGAPHKQTNKQNKQTNEHGSEIVIKNKILQIYVEKTE
jgi:hypothetical protein